MSLSLLLEVKPSVAPSIETYFPWYDDVVLDLGRGAIVDGLSVKFESVSYGTVELDIEIDSSLGDNDDREVCPKKVNTKIFLVWYRLYKKCYIMFYTLTHLENPHISRNE